MHGSTKFLCAVLPTKYYVIVWFWPSCIYRWRLTRLFLQHFAFVKCKKPVKASRLLFNERSTEPSNEPPCEDSQCGKIHIYVFIPEIPKRQNLLDLAFSNTIISFHIFGLAYSQFAELRWSEKGYRAYFQSYGLRVFWKKRHAAGFSTIGKSVQIRCTLFFLFYLIYGRNANNFQIISTAYILSK